MNDLKHRSFIQSKLLDTVAALNLIFAVNYRGYLNFRRVHYGFQKHTGYWFERSIYFMKRSFKNANITFWIRKISF